MKRKFIILGLITSALLLISAYSYGQTDKSKNKGGGAHKIEIIKKNDYLNDEKKSRSEITSLLKVNPTLFLNGEVLLFYERRFSDYFSFEVGAGPTCRNYLFDPYHYDIETILSTTNARVGIGVRSEIRVYPEGRSDFPEAYYFALGLRFKQNVLDFTPADYANPKTTGETYSGNMIGKNTFTDVVLLYGKQYLLDDHFYMDYYIGVGIRYKTIYDFGKIGEYTDPNDPNSQISVMGLTPTASTVPLFTMGLKFGYAF